MPKHDSKKKDLDALHDSHNEIMLKITTSLYEIWDRIGFNDTSKMGRLEKFFEKTEDVANSMLESEEDLEEDIKQNIEEHRANLKMLCIELALKHDDKFAIGFKLIDEEQMLRDRFKQLQGEKTKRLEEFKELSMKEGDLCAKLDFKKTTIKSTVPTESEIDALNKRIKELEKLKKERMGKMQSYQEEIMKYYHDLDMSQSDSFSELIFAESIENIPLSEDDLARASDLRDQLRVKDEKITEQIKSLKFKIRSLWSKLSISNDQLTDIVENNDIEKDMKDYNKAALCLMLSDEHERCVKIKMANLEKFIEQIRIEISVYFEKLYYSDRQIEQLGDFMKNNDFTEDLLKTHETKLEDLKFNYEESESLYEKTARWLDLWQQFILFEEKTKDPNRFKVRGYNSLNEEKERKQFNTQFPKLEEDLRKHAEEYKKTNAGNVFTIYGYEWNVYLDTLRKDYELHKQNEKKEKQQATAVAASKKDNLYTTRHAASKIATPAFQKPSVKRKNNECITSVLGQQTPSMLRSSKLQRTDSTVDEKTVISCATATPKVTNKLLSRGAAKRKSRTPLKQRLRRSRMASTKENATGISTASNNTTKASTISTRSKGLASPKASKYKVPTKLKQETTTNESNDTTLTATSNVTVTSKASTTTMSTTNASTYHASGYPFRQVNTNDINYHEFTRDLHKKPFKFNAGSKNTAGTSTFKYQHVEVDIKTKLTSTLME